MCEVPRIQQMSSVALSTELLLTEERNKASRYFTLGSKHSNELRPQHLHHGYA